MSNAASPNPSFQPAFQRFLNPLPSGGDWKKTISDSDLPQEIKELIRSVVQKSRLFRFEKAEIADELVLHFEDGKLRGKTFSELAESFGDPVVTACLIRRSKLRNRPMYMKIFKGLGYGAGALATAYLAILAFFHLGQTNPTIDYLGDFNCDIASVDQSDKAWPIYRPAWIKYKFSEGGGNHFDDTFVKDEDGNPRLARPTDEDWPKAVACLEKHEELLEAFREGAKRPFLGLELQTDALDYSDEDFAALFPHADKATYKSAMWEELDDNGRRIMDGSLVGILLPHVQSFRKAARLFHVDTRLAVEQGDSDRAVKNIETIFGAGQHAAEGRCLVCGLVGIAVSSIGFNVVEEVIETDPDFFSEEQLARIQSKIESLQPTEWIHYEGERASIKDMIQRAYTDDGNGDGRMTADGVELMHIASNWMSIQRQKSEVQEYVEAARPVYAPAAIFVCASRKEITEKTDEYIDKFIADTDIPFWISGGVDIEELIEEEGRMKYLLLDLMLPATAQIKNAAYRMIGRKEGVIAALAIHRYHKTYGEWPNEVDQLSPKFVTEFPIDQVDGSLVKFNYDDEGLVVYSVGNDKDDDGGAHKGDMSRSFFMFGSTDREDGDWVLWPVEEH